MSTNEKALLRYSDKQIEEYVRELNAVASLSNLFSVSTAPLIYYRATENIYCKAFGAKNVARSDCTADAIFGNVGVGIKTFLENSPFQKIAEFNRLRPQYVNLSDYETIRKIAQFRNDRIRFTINNYGLNGMIYHCIIRNEAGLIRLHEEKMNPISISNIRVLYRYRNSISFTDGIENYEFNISKSTLFKQFNCDSSFCEFKVIIIQNPIDFLTEFLDDLEQRGLITAIAKSEPSIIIPLYSENKSKGRFIPPSSGLNQWNGYRGSYKRDANNNLVLDNNGQKILVKKVARDPNEVYIPFSKKLREQYPSFFPPRNTKWKMHLPNGKIIQMKVCQDDGKALMSDPNRDLGQWLLRDVLGFKPESRHILTYEDLERIGIDSVQIWKQDDGDYRIDFIENTSRNDDFEK